MDVVNIRKKNLNAMGYDNLELWLQDPRHLYIGRDMTRYVKGSRKSMWSNPFSCEKYGRDECLRRYEEYVLTDTTIQANGKPLLQSLPELKDKVLGCWCSPDRCHGDVLMRLCDTEVTAEHVKKEATMIDCDLQRFRYLPRDVPKIKRVPR